MNLEEINSKVMTADTQKGISPDDALAILKAGNQRFLEKKMIPRNLNGQVEATGGGQAPFAAVVGCIDSRVPAEMVFDQGIGDIFNARIAGNFVNNDILGSLEFACKVAGSKLILVLGHTSCGAVKGACDGVELGNLTGMLENLKPALDSVDESGDRSAANPGFVQKVADANVKLTCQAIQDGSSVLKEMVDNGEIKVVGGMYDVKSGKVTFF